VFPYETQATDTLRLLSERQPWGWRREQTRGHRFIPRKASPCPQLCRQCKN